MALPKIGNIYTFRTQQEETAKYWYGNYWDTDSELSGKYVIHWADEADSCLILASVRPVGGGGNFGSLPGHVLWADVDNEQVQDVPVSEIPDDKRDGSIWRIERSTENDGWILWNRAQAQYAQSHSDTIEFVDDRKDATTYYFDEQPDGFPEVAKLGRVEPPQLEAPELTDYSDPPENTPWKIAGEVAVPYFLVANDHGHAVQWQGEHSPYYIIRRWSSWHKVKWQVYPAHTTHTHTWATTEGTTKEAASEVDRTLNASVTAEAGFGIKGFSASVSTTIEKGLNVKTSTKWSQSYSKAASGSYQVGPTDGDLAIGDWFRQDRYRVYRAQGGGHILEFPVTLPGRTPVSRTYMRPAKK
ncbi:hypothetical protein ITI46_07740 [Streptomyces oryzae]|uniref:Insecticidal crystal toxin domain-containing protein n=1 Tax=Streptomyces oryzae TaxID=1434886 RepID=A0ABS3X881_9ACTN|nr:hypothetical protein [Streptomyces oryzae]MBO8191584.1 hypothetical protein [Streptomyces oryzae]